MCGEAVRGIKAQDAPTQTLSVSELSAAASTNAANAAAAV